MDITQIANLITAQIQYNNKLTPLNLFDEIKNSLVTKCSGFDLVVKLAKPQRIEQSENFKYLICLKTNQVQIINKFHN